MTVCTKRKFSEGNSGVLVLGLSGSRANPESEGSRAIADQSLCSWKDKEYHPLSRRAKPGDVPFGLVLMRKGLEKRRIEKTLLLSKT